jgi:hypothetical protein
MEIREETARNLQLIDARELVEPLFSGAVLEMSKGSSNLKRGYRAGRYNS